MRPTDLHGTHTALVTPFTLDNQVDYAALEKLVENQVSAGVTGLVVLGTTGESPTVSEAEYQAIIQAVVTTVDERCLVIAGSGSNDTAHAIHLSELAAESGADALLVVNPYYNKPTQFGLRSHFTAVANAVDLPQILYNIQGRTAVNLSVDTLAQLAEHPNIIGVKEASGDLGQMTEVIAATPEDFVVLSGDDTLTLPLLSVGGHGVISVLSNLLPDKVVACVHAGLRGEFGVARRLHYELLPLMNGCFCETNPIPIKTALALRGDVKEQFRLPMCPMEEATRKTWQQLLTTHHAV